jgi:hypothetical protein
LSPLGTGRSYAGTQFVDSPAITLIFQNEVEGPRQTAGGLWLAQARDAKDPLRSTPATRPLTKPAPQQIWSVNPGERSDAKLVPRSNNSTFTVRRQNIYLQLAKALFSPQENVKII